MSDLKIGKKAAVFMKSTLIILTVLVVIVVLDNLFGEQIYNYMHNENNALNYEDGMTISQRLDDYEGLCKCLEQNMAALYDFESIYGISFEETKNKYKELISGSASDYEYFTLLLSFFHDIPSVHTNLVYPDKSNYAGGYNGFNVLETNGIDSSTEYWSSVIENECRKYSGVNYKTVSYNYNSGIYDSTITGTTMDMGTEGYTELISVNNIPIDEYVKACTSYFKMQYDFYNEKVYRDCLIFNDSFGEKCIIGYKDEYGNEYTKEVYGGISGEYTLLCLPAFTNEKAPTEEIITEEAEREYDLTADEVECEAFTAYRDRENNCAYIYISNFNINNDGARLRETIINMSDMDNIIIDIRGNGGGFTQYLELNVIPSLFKESSTFSSTVHFKDTSKNRSLKKYAQEYGSDYRKSDIKGLKCFDEIVDINGEADEQKNIYLLVSGATASAADQFTSIVKNSPFGIVIGTNTKGEGSCSYIMNCMPVSRLVFSYTPGKVYNDDNTVNNVCGTVPDIYADVSTKHYRQMKELGESAYIYENQKKWDDVLIKTLELIKEKENTK